RGRPVRPRHPRRRLSAVGGRRHDGGVQAATVTPALAELRRGGGHATGALHPHPPFAHDRSTRGKPAGVRTGAVIVPVGFRVLAKASPFDQRVAAMVRRIPAGRVASYGRIAEWIGEPAAARAVGGALARSLEQVPAHRVVTASGRLAPGWEREQRELLRGEIVRVRRRAVTEPIPWWEGPEAISR